MDNKEWYDGMTKLCDHLRDELIRYGEANGLEGSQAVAAVRMLRNMLALSVEAAGYDAQTFSSYELLADMVKMKIADGAAPIPIPEAKA